MMCCMEESILLYQFMRGWKSNIKQHLQEKIVRLEHNQDGIHW
jgi:hypothetical protein